MNVTEKYARRLSIMKTIDSEINSEWATELLDEVSSYLEECFTMSRPMDENDKRIYGALSDATNHKKFIFDLLTLLLPYVSKYDPKKLIDLEMRIKNYANHVSKE